MRTFTFLLQKIFSSLLTHISLAAILFSSSAMAKETLTWCAYYDWNPWVYPVEGTYQGILIDELKIFAEKSNVDTKVKDDLSWKRCQKQLEKGKIDMILGAYKTPEREKLFYYLDEPAFYNTSNIYVYTSSTNKKLDNINDIEQLRDFSVSVVRGDSLGNLLDKFVSSLPKNNVHFIATTNQQLQKVLLGRSDYLFSSESGFKSMLEQSNADEDSFKKVLKIQEDIPGYVIFSKKSDTYKIYGDTYIEAIKQYKSENNIQERIDYHKSQQ